MPLLANRRHEFFARLRAQGLLLEEAYERAGYVPGRGHASRLGSHPDVAERVMELRGDMIDTHTAERPAIIHELIALSHENRSLRTPAAAKEARLALMEAARLQSEMMVERMRDRDRMIEETLAWEAQQLQDQPSDAPKRVEQIEPPVPMPRLVATNSAG